MFGWLDYGARYVVENILNLSMETAIASSVHFFIYDSLKIVILLSIMIFSISYIRSYFPPEKTKKILEKYSGVSGNIMASLLGIVTPFCSCSSVPLFIGFVEAGIPLGVTLSFLITSPIVNEAAFAVLLASFGWKIAMLYVISGVIIGVIGGIIIGKLKMEDQVEEYVYEIRSRARKIKKLTQKKRLKFAKDNTKDIVMRVWLYILIGIGIGAIIHGYAPEAILAKYAGPDNPLAVIFATIIAVPLYSNALGTIPIAEALIGKGVGIGTALAFMMATTALSFPEAVLLRKVIKPKLIAAFFGITSIAIVITGYLFNILL
ncbi:permease [Methanococcus maripaludis C5]|uniref:Permease n=1 Tax=Methanococcus maripaludis (strain C5 / ATCC BAA-1333) TaxID=402880 RepID=A4FY45_METM5|nr:permease [Methanococcus maripaludis]ABO35129.1 permease [Methanococcus maripaludis C5]